MKIKIAFRNIIIQNIRDNNITLCAKSRELSKNFFFSTIGSLENSIKWIASHRYNSDNMLLEICCREDEKFIGTIGFTIEDGCAEIGRLTLYWPSVRELIKAGREIKGSMSNACLALACTLFKITGINKAFCKIMQDNAASNAICSELGLTEIKQAVSAKDIPAFCYSLTREEFERIFANELGQLVILPA